MVRGGCTRHLAAEIRYGRARPHPVGTWWDAVQWNCWVRRAGCHPTVTCAGRAAHLVDCYGRSPIGGRGSGRRGPRRRSPARSGRFGSKKYPPISPQRHLANRSPGIFVPAGSSEIRCTRSGAARLSQIAFLGCYAYTVRRPAAGRNTPRCRSARGTESPTAHNRPESRGRSSRAGPVPARTADGRAVAQRPLTGGGFRCRSGPAPGCRPVLDPRTGRLRSRSPCGRVARGPQPSRCANWPGERPEPAGPR